MYSVNSSKIEHYKNRRVQQYDCYDDNFRGFTREAQVSDDDFLKEEKKVI